MLYQGVKTGEQRILRNPQMDVKATIANAIRIERELRAMSDLRRGNIAKMQNISLQRETCQICYKDGHLASNCRKFIQNSQQNYEILICQICKKRGHDASKCRMRDPQSRRTVNVIRENTIVCQLCFKTGHNAKSCRSTNQNKPLLICQWCDRQGHSANNCWKKQNKLRATENKARIICQNCNNAGHTARDCRSRMDQTTSNNNTPFCRYCKTQGHLLENCELRTASNNRRMTKDSVNSNGPSKPGVQQGIERISRPSTSSAPQ
ncbi:hypothetical protein P5V15_009268 [Pogonomyrmex californicus]